MERKVKMNNRGRYYGTYCIYDVANSYITALHTKISQAIALSRFNSAGYYQNPRE